MEAVAAAEAPVEVAPAAAPEEPAIDLLHAVPTRVTASSAYRGDPAQVGRLFDGSLETAWNSQTGDLTGAWISITVPAEAQVTELRMTAGFTHLQGERDLFTGNHRVAEVRVSRDGTDLGTFPLDASSRELQRVPVSGGGGTYRVEIARVVAGERSDWREACISEMRVLGRAPGAIEGAHTPSVAIGASAPAAADTAPAEAAPAVVPAPPPETDAAYFAIRGRGLVRLGSAGPVELFHGAVIDFAVDEAGTVYVVPSGGERVVVIANGTQRDLDAPPNEGLCCVAIMPDGSPVIASAFGIWRRRRDAWGEREIMDPQRSDEGEQPQQLAVDGRGTIYARGQHSIFRTLAGRWMRDYLPGAGDLHAIALDARGAVVAAATNLAVFAKRPSWQTYQAPFGREGIREVAVGPDGTVAASSWDSIGLFPDGAEPRTTPYDGAVITGIAIDARGRVWVSGEEILLLGPDLGVLARRPARSTPWLGATIDSMRVTGRGPELPAQ